MPTPRIIKISAKNIVKFFGGIGDNHPMLQFLFNFKKRLFYGPSKFTNQQVCLNPLREATDKTINFGHFSVSVSLPINIKAKYKLLVQKAKKQIKCLSS